MTTITVKARIASTQPVPKYPGWRLSPEALEGLAERLREGGLPILFDHDAREPIAAMVLDATVVALDDSERALEAKFRIDANAWAKVQERFDEAGVTGGFSFTASVPQSISPSGRKPQVILAADAAAWTDADRADAAAILDVVAPTNVDRLFQYSALELATVFVILLEGVGLGILGNAAYDALKRLVTSNASGKTRIEIHRRGPDGATTKAIVTTDDPETARYALGALRQIAPSGQVQHFDNETRRWLNE